MLQAGIAFSPAHVPFLPTLFVQAAVGTGSLVRGMPVAVLPSGFRTCIPLFAAGADTSRSGPVLYRLPVCTTFPAAWCYYRRTDFRGGVLPLIVGLPYGKEAFFEASVLGESQKHHSALSELGIWKKTIMFSLLLLPFKNYTNNINS